MNENREKLSGLKRIRQARKLNQIQMANHLGISASCYRNFEQGRRQPKLDMLRRFTEVLNCSVEDIIGG